MPAISAHAQLTLPSEGYSHTSLTSHAVVLEGLDCRQYVMCHYIKIASDSEYRYTVNCGISVRSSFIEGCSSLQVVCKILLT